MELIPIRGSQHMYIQASSFGQSPYTLCALVIFLEISHCLDIVRMLPRTSVHAILNTEETWSGNQSVNGNSCRKYHITIEICITNCYNLEKQCIEISSGCVVKLKMFKKITEFVEKRGRRRVLYILIICIPKIFLFLCANIFLKQWK